MKPVSIRNVVAVLAVAAIAGCTNAEGTSVVTGQQRSAISPEQVQLYSEAPQVPYEVIGLVNASSANGWTDQQSVDYAVQELKNQAAAVGANGVILRQPGSQTGGFIMIDNIAYPYDEKTASGSAIFVSGG